MSNQNIEQLKEINEKITVLNQKRTQYIGAVESLKEQQKDLESTIKNDYDMTVKQLEKNIKSEKKKLEKNEQEIIKEFEKLCENEAIQSVITIHPPFTVDSIYKEIQNNLLNYKSKIEAEINSLSNQQKDIENTLKEEYELDIKDIEKEVDTLTEDLSNLEIEIQTMYNEIVSDNDIKELLERR